MDNLGLLKHFEILSMEDKHFEEFQGDTYGFKLDGYKSWSF